MFRICIAGLLIEIDNRFSLCEQKCVDYYVPFDECRTPDMRVSVSTGEMKEYVNTCGRPMSTDLSEFTLLYRKICSLLPRFDRFLLHAAVISIDGRGYAFSGPRGVGKTTHTEMWQSCFGSRMEIINGDKPIIRKMPDGTLWAYGTPWCGKEGLNVNCTVPLKAICFLSQSDVNTITALPVTDSAADILQATMLPEGRDEQDRMASLVGYVAGNVPCYLVSCRPDKAAAEMVFARLALIP